jgi:hypothetical protein
MKAVVELPAPDVIRARMAVLRQEQAALRKLLRLARAAEEAEQARRECQRLIEGKGARHG